MTTSEPEKEQKTVSLDMMLRERLQTIKDWWQIQPVSPERVPMKAMLGPDGTILVGVTRRQDRGPGELPRYHLVDRQVLDSSRHTCGSCEGCDAVGFAVALLLEEVALLRHQLGSRDPLSGLDSVPDTTSSTIKQGTEP